MMVRCLGCFMIAAWVWGCAAAPETAGGDAGRDSGRSDSATGDAQQGDARTDAAGAMDVGSAEDSGAVTDAGVIPDSGTSDDADIDAAPFADAGSDDDAGGDAGRADDDAGLDAASADDAGADSGVDAAAPDDAGVDAAAALDDAHVDDAGAMDAGVDAASSDAGPDGGAITADTGLPDAVIFDGGPLDAGRDAGPYVRNNIAAAITRQLSPLDLDQPAVLQIGTVSYFPVELQNVRVTIPPGFRLAYVQEDVSSRSCPMNDRCRQYFDLYMYPDGACRFNGDYVFTWDVGCALGGDCSRIDPSLTSYTITARPTSENFCDFLPVRTYDEFLATVETRTAVIGTNPLVLRFNTTVDDPYRLSAGSVSPPMNASVASFTEDVAARQCNTAMFPNACRQTWEIRFNVTGCLSGAYSVVWNVSCAAGGNCDPELTTYTLNSAVRDLRSMCAP